MVWTAGEHLLAIATNHLAHIAYVTAAVNTAEKDRKQIQFPEPIVRPGEKPPERRHRRPRDRIRTVPIDPRSIGGALIETTAEEVS